MRSLRAFYKSGTPRGYRVAFDMSHEYIKNVKRVFNVLASEQMFTAGNPRHRDPGADPQRTGAHDGRSADFPAVERWRSAMYAKQPSHLVAAV